MRTKKIEITGDYLMDYWLSKGHSIDVKWLRENERELIKTTEWYKKYAVSQELHDEWYVWAINEISKNRGWSKKFTKRAFGYDYLDLAPSVIKKEDD